MIALLLLHAVVGVATIAFGSRLGRGALLVAAVPSLVTVGWLATQLGDVVDGGIVRESVAWAPGLDLHVDLRLDGLSAVMVVLVAGVGVAVFAYGHRYFSATSSALARLSGLLTLFAGSMLGVVFADHLLVLYTCWELTSITSYLLIGNDHTSPKARAAALHALLLTGAGGLAMLGGFVVLATEAGTYRLHDLLERAPSGTSVHVALVLILVGVATKSAQYPFHGWLPGAMAAPTPVSAYLHSATMVKAGIYLLAHLAPVFAVVGFWKPLVLSVGLVTMIAGGLRALRQTDLKLLLAFGTVSQLGLMTVLFGLGSPASVAAGSVLLLAHGFFKAALFMVVGILDHQTGTRDIHELPVLGRRWRPLMVVSVISAGSMAGLPAAFGFVAKEAAYQSVLDDGGAGATVVLGLLVVGSAITAAYSLRFVWGAFFAAAGRDEADAEIPDHPAPSTPFVLPAIALAAATTLLGVVPGLADGIVGAAARSLHTRAEDVHLAVWHGFNTALALSVVAMLGGVALFVLRDRAERVLRSGARIPDSSDVYLGALRALNAIANRSTGIVQNGSLPVYTAVILLTVAGLPVLALAGDIPWNGWPAGGHEPGHVLVSIVIVGSALAATALRRRLSAIVLLGVTGYGMAALFLVRGAPDLALTQVAIETLTTVVFVLVLRRLPDQFERRSVLGLRVLRFGIAGIVAAAVFTLALLAGSNRVEDRVSDEMIERAEPDGHGRNVVNVILVDFRALDTMGEITVLATAAIGAVALARAGRRPRDVEQSEAVAPQQVQHREPVT